MTTKEKIQLRDKARADFEGKLYKGKLIYEASIVFKNSDKGGAFCSTQINLIGFDNKLIYDFDDYLYNNTLTQCSKPFPRDGFSIRLKDNEVYSGIYYLSKYVSIHLKCGMSVLNENVNTEKTLYTEVTLQQIKDEAKRILEL